MDLDPKTWWYLTRATGFVSWSLLALSMLWGLFITNKTLHRSTPPAWVLDLHRHLGGLAVIFVAVHVGVLPLDGYTQWGWADLVIPLHSDWHPVAIAWGIVATYLLLAVEISSLLQRRLPRKWWRRIHVLSFPLYVLASIHLFTAGTDTGNPYAQGLVLVVSTLIVFLTIVRVLAAAKPRETTRSRVPPRPRPPRRSRPRLQSRPPNRRHRLRSHRASQYPNRPRTCFRRRRPERVIERGPRNHRRSRHPCPSARAIGRSGPAASTNASNTSGPRPEARWSAKDRRSAPTTTRHSSSRARRGRKAPTRSRHPSAARPPTRHRIPTQPGPRPCADRASTVDAGLPPACG